jgi:hypothetical protein
MKFEKSERKNKKYKVKYAGKYIHFGDTRYEHFKDTTGLGLYSDLDHNDKKRKKNYCERTKYITDKEGNYTKYNKNSANYYSRKYLWGC